MPLQCRRPLEGPAETKKARHRRCFKPPVQTLGRPQARANLGKSRSMRFALKTQGKTALGCRIGGTGKKKGRPGPPPPIAPRSDEVEILVQSPRAQMSVASRRFLHQPNCRVPPVAAGSNPFSRPVPMRQHPDFASELGAEGDWRRSEEGPFVSKPLTCDRLCRCPSFKTRPWHERSGDESASLWIFRACSHTIWCLRCHAPQVSALRKRSSASIAAAALKGRVPKRHRMRHFPRLTPFRLAMWSESIGR